MEALGRNGNVEIRLTRTPVERVYIIAASAIFFLLSLLVAVTLFSSPTGLTSVQEVVSVAGFLVAAAGFRELLGLSQIRGTTILEILIVGVPLVILAVGVASSVLRAWRNRAKSPGIAPPQTSA